MPAVAAILQSGDIPSTSFTNETSLLVQSVTFSASRDEKEYLNASGAVQGWEGRNPKLSIAYDCFITDYSGLVEFNPGQEVTSLANFSTSKLGFAPGDGTLIFKEPTITESNTESAKMTFTVVQYPFCE